MRRKSTTGGQHSFARIPSANIQRSKFNRSCGLKTTLDSAGVLYPCFVDEALPGDTMALKMTSFARFATPIHPVMDNVFLDVFFFAVPIRLVWDNWKKFNGEQTNPGDSTDYVVPTMTIGVNGHFEGSIYDYMGIPTKVAPITHNTLPLRAYSLIWNEWFRDENIQNSVAIPKGDGPDTFTQFNLLRRGKRHDYFSSALPWPQKGPAVSLGFETNAPVISTGDGVPHFLIGGGLDSPLRSITGQAEVEWDQLATSADAQWNVTALEADLMAVNSATINQIREAFQIQRMYERDARGGTRYTEILRSHFGVISPDARLQRPEFLGGGTFALNVHPVPKTAEDGTDPQGNLAGYGVASGTNGFTKSFTEHCVVLGMVAARADLNYQQGLDRMWSRSTRFDFYWPALSHLGEQAVLNKEIYVKGDTTDEDVFGYQERYAEYRYKPSKITGKMRSNATGTLDSWHLAQNFADTPTLSPTFIEENPPIERVIAVQTEPHFILDAYFSFTHARPMPTYGVPGMIDHF